MTRASRPKSASDDLAADVRRAVDILVQMHGPAALDRVEGEALMRKREIDRAEGRARAERNRRMRARSDGEG